MVRGVPNAAADRTEREAGIMRTGTNWDCSTSGGTIMRAYESRKAVRQLVKDEFRTTVEKIGDRKFELHHKT